MYGDTHPNGKEMLRKATILWKFLYGRVFYRRCSRTITSLPWATKSLSQQPSLHIWMGCCLEGREMRGEHRRGQNRSGVKWSRTKQWTFLFHLLFPSLIKCISLAPLNVFLSLCTFFSWIIVTVITDGQRNIVSDERM